MRWKNIHAPVGFAIATLVVVPGTALAARVDYNVDLGVEHNDNVSLSPDDAIAQRYLRAGLGFTVTENTSALQAQVNGRVEYRNYEDDIFNDTTDGTLSGRVNWIAIPQRLFFTVEDSLSVQPVNALSPDGPGNRQQVNVFSAGPTLLVNWSPSLQGQAELRYIDSNAEISDQFNSKRVAAALRTIKELSPTRRLSANLQAQKVDFDDDIVARDYDRYDLFGRYSHSLAHVDLGVDAGYSRIEYQHGESRSEPLLRADVTWNPTERSHFTGTISSQFSDTATDALTRIEADATVPDNVLTGDAVINASPYKVRSLDLGYSHTDTRLDFGASAYVQNRDYIDSDQFDQDTHGVRADVHWLLRRTLALGLFANGETIDYTQLNRKDDTVRLGATLRYHWARKWSVSLQAEHYRRDSTEAGQDVAQNIVYLSVSYSNR
ncbi:MAG: outer membrane beta-barrel protein [Pseudoxanthomonas sp.]